MAIDPIERAPLGRAILEVVDTPVLVLGREGRIQYVNPGCERLTGYAAEELVGAVIFDVLIPEEQRAEVRSYWQDLWAGVAGPRHRNAWTTKEGERRVLEWANAIVEPDVGERYVVSTATDVTRRRELEQDIVQVSESERRRIGQDLHDGLASDLVAAAMKLETLRDALKREALGPEAVWSRLGGIEQSVREGARRARSLSHLLAAEDLQHQSLSSALADLVQTYQELSEADCVLQLPDEKGPDLGDGPALDHLYRIAQEAVRNAVHHGSPDRVEVRVEVTGASPTAGDEAAKTTPGETLVLRVRDDGTGFSGDGDAEAAPAGGNRGEEGDCEPDPGADTVEDGIGLHLMRSRADLIGATLTIHSEEDRGTEVRCEVPLS